MIFIFAITFFVGWNSCLVFRDVRRIFQARSAQVRRRIEIDDNGHRVLVIGLTRKRHDSTLGESPGSVGGETTPCAVPNQDVEVSHGRFVSFERWRRNQDQVEEHDT